MLRLHAPRDRVCPFINQEDPRCASRFRLSRLGEAFDVCLREPESCPVHAALSREQASDQGRAHAREYGSGGSNPTIHITVEGRVPAPRFGHAKGDRGDGRWRIAV